VILLLIQAAGSGILIIMTG